MSGKPFDASLKDLIEDDPRSWAVQFNPFPVYNTSFIDADVSTVTAAADKVLRVEDEHGVSLLNIEAEGRHAADAPGRMLLYSTVLGHRHQLPVRSVLILLRRSANASNLTGLLEQRRPGEADPYLVFRYRVMRVWEEPLAPLLAGGLGTLPLAALTDEAEPILASVIRRMDERPRGEAPPAVVGKMRATISVLLGLRYEGDQIMPLWTEELLEESSFYQMILARGETRGRLAEARQVLLRLGRIKFGEPDAATIAALDAIVDLNRLEAMSERLLAVSTWQELLATP